MVEKYIQTMVSDAIKQEYAEDCFDDALKALYEMDLQKALIALKQVRLYSISFELSIAAIGMIKAIESKDFTTLKQMMQAIS